jgi:hypothetical protein
MQARQLPPYSSAICITVGVSLVAAGVLNGGAQYLGHLIAGADYDQDFGISWGAANPVWYQTEQFALLIGFLLWDFLLPPVGPLEAHVLLLISLAWLGVHVIRMPQSTWLGSRV